MIQVKKESGVDYEARLRREFRSEIDPRLRAMAFELDDWLYQQYYEYLTITCLNRTEKENKAVNGSKWSGHLFGRCFDGRTWGWDMEKRVNVVNHLYDVWGNEMIYVVCHDSGTGDHMHLGIRYNHSRRENFLTR